ncbi:MAG: hypothetical protein L0191_10030, partial [Acidobacteria bacterium]|nr:hypothetical protein [Acidobacteriota bacterium]
MLVPSPGMSGGGEGLNDRSSPALGFVGRLLTNLDRLEMPAGFDPEPRIDPLAFFPESLGFL